MDANEIMYRSPRSKPFELKTAEFSKKDGFRTFLSMYLAIYDMIFDDYKRKMIAFKVVIGKRVFMMYAAEVMIHMVIWFFNIYLDEKITGEDVYQLHPLTPKKLEKIIDYSIEKFSQKHGVEKAGFVASKIMDELAKISRGYSTVAGITFSIWDIAQLEKRSPAFKRLVNTELDERLPIKEIENFLNASRNMVRESIIADGQSSLVPLVQADLIKNIQLGQMFVAVGPRPNIDKTVMPKIITGNYLRGYKNAAEFYVEASTSLDALITKHRNLGDSGYLSRKMNLLALDVNIDYDVDDCGTQNFMTYNVEDLGFLKAIHGKNIVLDNGNLYCVDQNKDQNLIGKTVQMRTMMKCAHQKTATVCKACVGHMEKILVGTRIGGLPAIKWANPMSQAGMSAKHASGTNSVEITDPVILKYFHIHGQELFFRKEMVHEELYFGLESDQMDMIDSEVDMTDDSVDISANIHSITIYDGEEEYMLENEGVILDFTKSALEAMVDIDFESSSIDIDNDEEEVTLVKIKDLPLDEPIFSITHTSEEITKYLSLVKSHIEGKELKEHITIETLVREIVHIMNSTGIKLHVNHMEPALYNLMRDPMDETKRPNFSFLNPIYVFRSMSQAIRLGPLTTAMGLDRLRDQLLNDRRIFQKETGGIFDDLFRVTPL